jgi:hypothetical protein
MSLVRWLRKNNKKVMAVVVIVILFGFIGGSQLLQLLDQRRTRNLASYGTGQRVSNLDLSTAKLELDLLQELQAPAFLQSQQLHGVLLNELLFRESQADPRLIGYLKQMIQNQGLRITDKQISEMYQARTITPIYWILLKAEAEEAGIGIPNEEMAPLLAQIAKQLFRGGTYQQLLNRVMAQHKLSEQDVLSVYSELAAVLRFAQLTCSMGDVSTSQLRHQASSEKETIDAEFLKLEGETFSQAVDPNSITDQDLEAHFNAYKGITAGPVSDESPYGFGYKLADRVQLEYLIIELEDVKSIIDAPTQEESEEFYQRNVVSLYTQQVSTDPNDPNSAKQDIIQKYPEVVLDIQKRLVTNKVVSKAQTILQEARSLADEQAQEPNTLESVDYTSLASSLSKTHKITVHTGKTGLLSRANMRTDSILNRLMLSGRNNNQVPLNELLYSVEPLVADDLALLNVPRPTLFENIGPAKDSMTRPDSDVANQSMAVVRIIQVVPATEPAKLDSVLNINGITLTKDALPRTESIKDTVNNDVKQLRGYKLALTQANAFMVQIEGGDWDAPLAQLNADFKQMTEQDPNSPDVFSLTKRPLRRIPVSQLDMMESFGKKNPMFAGYYKRAKSEHAIANKLYAMIPTDQDKLEALSEQIESPAELAVYCLKSLSVTRLSLQDYDASKGRQMGQEEMITAQSLAAVHFNPANILQRMNFEWAPTDDKTDQADANDTE